MNYQNNKELIAWLRIARARHIGCATAIRLFNSFGSATKIIESIPHLMEYGQMKKQIELPSDDFVEQEIYHANNFGAMIIPFDSDLYPPLLSHIYSPPLVITVKGDSDFLRKCAIGIVGTRNASTNSKIFARKIALELGQRSITIASGMAAGIDTAAHQGSILSGTIAVIAGGINHIYPRENNTLYNQIANSGLLISESAFGANPHKESFVKRNRIISGISTALIVIEAGLKSGSLTTARFAIEQGREVFVVPGSPFDERCKGSNKLIKDGAHMLEDVEDLVKEIPSMQARFVNNNIANAAREQQPILDININNDLKALAKEIVNRLSFDPLGIEYLIEDLGVSVQLAYAAIAQLELIDVVEVKDGKIYLIANNGF